MFVRRIIRHRVEKILLHVVADGRIAVFVKRQGSGSVLEQQMQHTDFDARQRVELAEDLVSYQMKTARFCA
ncbi:Uncharacterised protein [Raoultella ornithinolytica]|nr:Uncharacterised protein [Raoultella ornithinolytica]